MQAKGRGMIGMKLVGAGDFQNPEDREKAVRFAMARPEINAVVIGFKSRPGNRRGHPCIDRARACRFVAISALPVRGAKRRVSADPVNLSF